MTTRPESDDFRDDPAVSAKASLIAIGLLLILAGAGVHSYWALNGLSVILIAVGVITLASGWHKDFLK